MASNEQERDAWLAQVSEAALEPELPIVDPHHHLWDHPGSRYMLDEIVRDTASGHRVLATVFVECLSMYRADGPEPMRPVGETEFVNGIAAQSASGQYGETRVAAGIVGFADLTLGAAVEPVLQAHIAAAPARFRGIRHAGGFDANPAVRNSHTNPPADLYESTRFREGFAKLRGLGLSFEAWQYHPQMPAVIALARAFPDTMIVLDHFGGPLGIGPYEGRRARDIRPMEEEPRGTRAMSKCRGQARWNQHAGEWIRLASEAVAAELRRTRGGDAGLLSPHDRSVWAATMHVREQLPGGQDLMLVRRALERIQEDRGGFHEGRKSTAIPAHRVGGLSLDAHAQGTEPGAGAVTHAA